MTKDEALKMAWESEKKANPHTAFNSWCRGYEAGRRQALAEPPNSTTDFVEPVAWITPAGEGWRIRFDSPADNVPLGWTPLYAAPPKREWTGLTDEYLLSLGVGQIQTARTVEAKLKELNHG